MQGGQAIQNTTVLQEQIFTIYEVIHQVRTYRERLQNKILWV